MLKSRNPGHILVGGRPGRGTRRQEVRYISKRKNKKKRRQIIQVQVVLGVRGAGGGRSCGKKLQTVRGLGNCNTHYNINIMEQTKNNVQFGQETLLKNHQGTNELTIIQIRNVFLVCYTWLLPSVYNGELS